MALGMMLPGMAAGYIKEQLLGNSYVNFFFGFLPATSPHGFVTLLVRRNIDPAYGAKTKK